MATFTRTQILDGLQRLGQLAQEKGIHVQFDSDGRRGDGTGVRDPPVYP